MIEPRRVTLYTVSEEEVLLEAPLMSGGYWTQCNIKPKPIENYNSGELAFEDPRQEYGAFYTEMQAHHVVNQLGENMFVSFDPKVMEIFKACQQKVLSEELDKRDRDINRLKGIIKKLEMANQDISAKMEERLGEGMECLKAANTELKRSLISAEQDRYRYTKLRLLQNAFVYSPLWRRLLIALFPVRHFK